MLQVTITSAYGSSSRSTLSRGMAYEWFVIGSALIGHGVVEVTLTDANGWLIGLDGVMID